MERLILARAQGEDSAPGHARGAVLGGGLVHRENLLLPGRKGHRVAERGLASAEESPDEGDAGAPGVLGEEVDVEQVERLGALEQQSVGVAARRGAREADIQGGGVHDREQRDSEVSTGARGSHVEEHRVGRMGEPGARGPKCPAVKELIEFAERAAERAAGEELWPPCRLSGFGREHRDRYLAVDIGLVDGREESDEHGDDDRPRRCRDEVDDGLVLGIAPGEPEGQQARP